MNNGNCIKQIQNQLVPFWLLTYHKDGRFGTYYKAPDDYHEYRDLLEVTYDCKKKELVESCIKEYKEKPKFEVGDKVVLAGYRNSGNTAKIAAISEILYEEYESTFIQGKKLGEYKYYGFTEQELKDWKHSLVEVRVFKPEYKLSSGEATKYDTLYIYKLEE
jgi:hypothetical protein